MKNPIPSITRRFALCAALFSVTGAFSAAQTTDWYLVSSNLSEQNWNSTNSSQSYKYWADSPSIVNYTGSESHYATSMDGTATYHVIGTSSSTKDVRTAGNSSPADFAFQGGKLVLENQYSRLLVRTTGANVSTIANLESIGGLIQPSANNNQVHNLSIGTFRVTGPVATLLTGASTDSNRTLNLTIDTLVGDGDIAFSSASATQKYTLSIGDASGYTGNFLLTAGELTFTSAFQTAGSLMLTSGIFDLTQDITVSSLTVSGTGLGAGTYSATDLAGYAAGGLTINGDASIIVSAIPEPACVTLLAGVATLLLAAHRRRRA